MGSMPSESRATRIVGEDAAARLRVVSEAGFWSGLFSRKKEPSAKAAGVREEHALLLAAVQPPTASGVPNEGGGTPEQKGDPIISTTTIHTTHP